MKLIIDIPEKNFIKDNLIHFFGCYSTKLDEVIKNGIPLDDIKIEIENIEINGYIRDVECFNAGINTALKVIDNHAGKERMNESMDIHI